MSDETPDIPSWRVPDAFERAVFDRLSALDEQAHYLIEAGRSSRTRRIISENGDYQRIEFEIAYSLQGPHKLEADLVAHDSDGVPINMLFFSQSAAPLEVELIRMDGLPIRSMPDPEKFELTDVVYPRPERKSAGRSWDALSIWRKGPRKA